jgi:hypothetical protein
VHDSEVTESWEGTPSDTGVDHVVPPSSVVRNLGPVFEKSKIAHVIAEKQLTDSMPDADLGAVATVMARSASSKRHTRSPLDCDPTNKQPSFQHDEEVMTVEVSAVGTARAAQ